MTHITDLNTRNEYLESERQELDRSLSEKDETILELCKKNAMIERQLKSEIEKIKISYDSERKIQLLNIQNAKEGLKKTLSIIERL